MTRIGLLSDTHGYSDAETLEYFADCDEIWHGGDFGPDVIETLEQFCSKGKNKILRGVYGNIDDFKTRLQFPEVLIFMCEGVKVMMKHIGGYPPKYNAATKKEIIQHHPQLFISGHSHILKVMYDDALQCLHMNPGAAGKQGWHKVRTVIRFVIDGKEIKDCEVMEMKR